ncbi:MAG: AraC family transcriptional regulator [Bifidobacteriaceae bacterium]|jgi:AraC-like DNA-binding protein|nr:AraC family transcriptional regulator [Bifidobacteriaceae bacterium]
MPDQATISRLQAEVTVEHMLTRGHQHQSYQDERKAYNALFHLERAEFTRIIDSPGLQTVLLGYAEVLGPNRLRGAKNALICLITPVCRIAIELGVNSELSYTLSDYYINSLEAKTTEEGVAALARQVLVHYFDLIQEALPTQYSKPIALAINYIDKNLYGPCRVAAVANYVGLEPHYFSKLFSLQVGLPPSQYIRRRKLEEARCLLSSATVTEVAEALGFCDVAHFSRCFKAAYAVSPSQAGTGAGAGGGAGSGSPSGQAGQPFEGAEAADAVVGLGRLPV